MADTPLAARLVEPRLVEPPLEQEVWFQNLIVGVRGFVQNQASRQSRPHLLAAIDEAARRLQVGRLVDPSPSTESVVVLRPSPRGGVGCFTTTAIPRGAVVHLFDDHDWTFVAGDAEALPEPLAHYVVLTKGGYWRPLDFARMSVGWYLNHSDAPNLRKEHDTYYAIYNIGSGVELTIDYRILDADEDNAIGLARVDPSPLAHKADVKQ